MCKLRRITQARGHKTCFMLNSTEHEIFHLFIEIKIPTIETLFMLNSAERHYENTPIQIYRNRHSGSVVERPLCDREVAGSIPGRVIPKTLKMVLAALSLGAQH